jgi:hypothetical protein
MSNAYDNASLLVTPNGYEAGTIFSAKPTDGSGDLSFSRASTALRRNSAGLWEEVANNVPRLHYPVGGGCPSWLFEGEATNQLPYNTTFTGWTQVLQSFSTGVQSPISGVLSKRLLVTGAGSNYLLKNLSATGTRTITASLMVKNVDYVGSEIIAMNVSDGVVGGMTAYYRPSNDTITFAAALSWSNVAVKKTAESEGFTRIQITGTVTSASGGWFEITGVNGRSIDITAPQVETGIVASSPIVTGAAAVTRITDQATTAGKSKLTNTNFTLAIKLKSGNNVSSGNPYLGIDDVFFTDGVYLLSSSGGDGNRWRAFVRRSSVSTTILSDTLDLLIAGQTIVIKVDGAQVKVFLAGTLRTTNTLAGSLPILPNVYASAGGMSFEEDLFMTYNKALSDTECINLSNL